MADVRHRNYVPLVNLIGVFYQIRDDYYNLQSTEVCATSYLDVYFANYTIKYEHNKGFAEDLSEGKFSFPVVHGVRSDMSNRQILSMFFISF